MKRAIIAAVAAGFALFVVAGASAGAASATIALPAPGPSDLGIAVTITAPPIGGGTSGLSGSSGGAGNGGATSGTAATTTPGTQLATLPAANAFDGTLYVSGLSADFHPQPDPLAGEMLVSFVVRNVSTEPFDSTARFWLTNVSGAVLSESAVVPVAGLQPNETRVVRTTLGGTGQWTVVGAHMELKPPTTIAGHTVLPLQRDVVVFALPWVWTALAIVGVAVGLIFFILRHTVLPMATSEAA